MFIKTVSIALAASIMISCTGKSEETKKTNKANMSDNEIFLLIGTYTSNGGSEGIYVHRFNTETGESDSLSMAEAINPSYLAINSDEEYVYAVGENSDEMAGVYSFSFDKETGILHPINFQSTQSPGPCYVTIDQNGRNVHTANYGGGSISSFQVNSDGSLTTVQSVLAFEGSGPDSTRQQRSHVHSVMYSPDEDYLFAADLGSDKLYRLSIINSPFAGQPTIVDRSLKEFDTPPGTGPRHFDFHPNGGSYLYLLGELSGEVLVYDYDDGGLELKQRVLADSVSARGSADIHVSPNGHYLYASNRLEADGIAIFSIDSEDGTLTKVGYQPTARHPRNFVISPNGKYLLVAGRDDNKIQVFEIDAETGLLTNTNQNILISKPVCLKFV